MWEKKIRRLLRLTEELLASGGESDGLGGILCQSEVVILCLEISDEIDVYEFPSHELLKWHEVSASLKRIAYAVMELQVVRTDAESAEDPHRRELEELSRSSERIRTLLGLPEECEAVPETVSVQVVGRSLTVRENEALTAPASSGEMIILNEDETISRLRKEIRLLREELAALLSEKNNLELVECRRLQAVYSVEIESLLGELYRKQYELRYLKREIQLIRAALNRQETVTVEALEERLKKEDTEFRARFDEFMRKVYEAREYQKKHTQDPEEARSPDTADSVPPEEDRRSPEYRKKLYRNIVKAMHPDLHPDQTSEEADLFKKANIAYEDGDTDTLEMIWQTVSGGKAEPNPEDSDQVQLEALLSERARLTELILLLRRDIDRIRSSFPYNLKDILEDPEKLEQRKAEIRVRIDEAEKDTEKSRSVLEELKKKL